MKNIVEVIKVKCVAGACVRDCLNDMQKLSIRRDVNVTMVFNGVSLSVYPFTSVDRVVKYYNSMLNKQT